MEKYKYKDEVYYYNNGKWLTSFYTSVPSGLLSELNKLLCVEKINEMTFVDKLKLGDNAKRSGNIGMALEVFENLFLNASKERIECLLPRLTSVYRLQNDPQKAIDTANAYLTKYGKSIASCPLYTSLAAAFCDIEDWKSAKIYADYANRYGNSKNNAELMAVYSRIKKQME